MRRLIVSFSAVSVATMVLAGPASANIMVPSFVQMLTAPLAWIVFIVPVPVILGIALLESLVVRRYAGKARGFWRLLWSLCIVNAVSSLLGLVAYPPGAEIWPGVPIAYSLTVAAEAVLLFLFTKDFPGISRFRQALLISGRMNLASYVVLTPILAGLIYIPSVLNESPEVAEAATGTIFVHRFDDLLELPIDVSRAKDSAAPKVIANVEGHRAIASDPQTVILAKKRDIIRLSRAGKEWEKTTTPIPAGLEVCHAVSPDGSLLCCEVDGGLWIVSAADGKSIHKLQDGGSDRVWGSFSNDNRYFAWEEYDQPASCVDLSTGKVTDLPGWNRVRFHPTQPVITGLVNGEFKTLDLKTGKTRTFETPGRSQFSLPVFSPDGRYIAYLGSLNQFTAQQWSPDVVVVDTQTGNKATIRHNVWTSGAPCSLFWVE